jgi:hypothetical protein
MIVQMTDQSKPVTATVLVSNVRGHGVRGAGTRFGFRLDEERFCVESGDFFGEDGKQLNLPRTGLVLVDVPACAWVKRFEEPSR